MASNKKKRDCPALNRVIRRDECGRWRHSEVDCPAGCEFNPFGPGQYVESFIAFEGKLLELLEKTAVLSLSGKTLSTFEQQLRKGDDLAIQADLLRLTQVDRDAEGRNLPERLLADPGQRWKNDETVLLRALAHTRPAFMEIRKILDDRRLEVIDYLGDPAERLIVCDRSLAATCCRFDMLYAWTYRLPHFNRLRGTVISFEEMGPLDGWEAFCEIIRHLGGDPERLVEDPTWLLDQASAIRQLQERAHRARQRLMLEQTDAWYCTADYRSDSETAAKRLTGELDSRPGVAIDPPATDSGKDDFSETRRWTWLDPEGLEKRFKHTWGVVRHNAFQRTWRIEAADTRRYEQLKAAFEKAGGESLIPTGDTRTNLVDQLREKASAHGSAEDVPDRLLQETGGFDTSNIQISASDMGDVSPARLMEIQVREYMDQSVPVLNGKTLAEAAAVPELRQRALNLLKGQINFLDRKNLEAGTNVDIQDLVNATGLTEALEPAPPLREPVEPMEEVEEPEPELPPGLLESLPEAAGEGDGVYSLLDQMDPGEREETLKRVQDMTEEAYRERPLCPRPRRRLSVEEVDRRIGKGLARFESVEGILTEMNLGSGASLLQDLSDLIDDYKIRKAFGLGVFCGVSTAWLGLVKPGHRVRRIAPDELSWFLESLRRKIENTPLVEEIDDLHDGLEDTCAQPAVAFAALDAMMDYYEDQAGRELTGRPPRDIVRASLLVRAFIDAVLQAMGSRP